MSSVNGPQALPDLAKGRFGASRLVQWCAAQQNWDRIHYDQAFAQASGLRERVVNGALKQHLLVQFLERAFDNRGWAWRLDFSFLAPDWVDEALEVRGRIGTSQRCGAFQLHQVELEIWNVDQQSANTRASAVVVLDPGADRPLLALPDIGLPAELMLDRRFAAPDPDLPSQVAGRIGTVVEAEESLYPLSPSRLRLFAEAVGDCPHFQFDVAAGAAGAHGSVVAPALFPIHAIELAPGTRPLDPSARATGREGSSEIGRNLAARLGLAEGAALNGGSSVEIHSLLAVGERVRAESRLAGVRTRESRQGGRLLIIESLNEYRVAGSERLLLRERSRAIHAGASAAGEP
jgi:acyl dehydratase